MFDKPPSWCMLNASHRGHLSKAFTLENINTGYEAWQICVRASGSLIAAVEDGIMKQAVLPDGRLLQSLPAPVAQQEGLATLKSFFALRRKQWCLV